MARSPPLPDVSTIRARWAPVVTSQARTISVRSTRRSRGTSSRASNRYTTEPESRCASSHRRSAGGTSCRSVNTSQAARASAPGARDARVSHRRATGITKSAGTAIPSRSCWRLSEAMWAA
jgi:hypothetical protein